jgi:acyl carrier protein
MSETEVLDLFAEALEVEPGRLAPDTRIEDVSEWDSVGWLTLMAAVEERLGVELVARDVREMKTVGDVLRYIAARVSVPG